MESSQGCESLNIYRQLMLAIPPSRHVKMLLDEFLLEFLTLMHGRHVFAWMWPANDINGVKYSHSPVSNFPKIGAHVASLFPSLNRFVREYREGASAKAVYADWRQFDGQGFHLFPLASQGIIALARNDAFSNEQVTLLEPVFKRLEEACAICWDLQRLTYAKQRALTAVECAEAANKAKGEFLKVISHELRTPLHGILGLCGLMFRDDLDGEQLDNLRGIKSSANGLLGIISEILDMSQIDSRVLRLQCESFELKPMLENALRSFDFLAQKKSLSLQQDIGEALNRRVMADSNRLKQVINNLLGNALKFTDVGTITFSAQPFDLGAHHLGVNFVVADTGVGIASENFEKIFRPFTQADSSVKRKYGGTGLGLAISSNLVELMGGKLTVSSHGEGSRFEFSVRFDLAETAVAARDTSIVDGSGGRAASGLTPSSGEDDAYHVLLVEDNVVNRMVAEKILQKLGFRISIAENGREGVDLWASCQPDIVLMDVQMPVMDGLEATRLIRRQQVGYTPIVALTANAHATDQKACMDAGMDYFLSKPFTDKQLAQVIDEAVLCKRRA